MPLVRLGIRRLLRQESGYSLIELLVAMSLSMLVLGAVLGLLEAFARAVPKETERAHVINEAQVGLDRMVRELRQAYQVVGRTPDMLHVRLQRGGQLREVVYSCSEPHPTMKGLYRCLRWEINGGTPGPKAVVVDRTLNGPSVALDKRPFRQPQPTNPSWNTVTVSVPASGERVSGYGHAVTLSDGFHMRNCDASC